MNRRDELALALDVGGTHIRLAVVDGAGHIHARRKYKASLSRLKTSSGEKAGEKILEILTASITEMRAKHPDIQTAGIGFPGFFRQQTGSLASSPNIPQLVEFPLAERLSRALILPVFVQNDATLTALGEFRFGAGKGLDSLLHLTLGTGIGGGLVLNGVPYFGEGGLAMEIGHLCVASAGNRPAKICGCGGTGCLETYASAPAVAARYADISGCPGIDAKDVYLRAKKNDARARQALEEAGNYLGYAIAQAIKLLDVHHISISGGLAGAWDILAPSLLKSMDAHLIPPLKGMATIHPSRLGDDAGLLGAAALALSMNRAG